MTSCQETERVYSYNPGIRTGHTIYVKLAAHNPLLTAIMSASVSRQPSGRPS